jgi:hypothetical protein
MGQGHPSRQHQAGLIWGYRGAGGMLIKVMQPFSCQQQICRCNYS